MSIWGCMCPVVYRALRKCSYLINLSLYWLFSPLKCIEQKNNISSEKFYYNYVVSLIF